MYTKSFYEKAARLNQHYKDEIGWTLGAALDMLNLKRVSSCSSKKFSRAVAQFQREHGLSEDGIIGPNTYENMVEQSMTGCDRAINTISKFTIEKESGGDYAAMNKDGEYKGKFDDYWNEQYGHDHPASKVTHVGLSFGVFQFTQDSGSLGEMLQLACQENKTKFINIFGDRWQELLNVLTAPGESGLSAGKLRGPRVQPVPTNGGKRVDIWKKPWTDRFRTFGKDAEFQAVQRRYVVSEYLEPILPFLKERDLTSERMVAASFSAAIHRGVNGAKGFIDDHGTLSAMAHVDDRYDDFIRTDELTWDKWKGFELCDLNT